MTSTPVRCRSGLHAYLRHQRDAERRFVCRRCGQPGVDACFDAERMPPGSGEGIP